MENPALVTGSDIHKLKEVGWSEEAIYDALTVASLFKFYNTWNNGSGVQQMSSADYLGSSQRLITLGYCMDFSLKAILKTAWVGRKEINYTDLKGLVKITFSKFAGVVRVVLLKCRNKDAVKPSRGQTNPARPHERERPTPIFTEIQKGV